MKNKIAQLLFILVLLVVSFFYDYQKIIFKRPQAVHAWRQSDAGSLALNYYQGGMKFFKPKVHNLTSDNGTTGYSAPSEIPLLYYTVSLFYHVFGYHEFIYRLLNTLIFLTGLYYLFKGIRLITRDNYWAATIVLFTFSSPVLVYYGNNFLTNSSGLSMVFITWYFFFRYTKDRKKNDLIFAFLFLFLGGALKITALLSYFTLAGLFILENLFHVKLSKVKLFPHQKTFILCAILTVVPIIAWIIYASWYNNYHDSTYFSTTLFPIWSLSTESINNVLTNIKNVWLREYFSRTSMILIVFLLSINFIFYRKLPAYLVLAQLLLILQVLVFVLLQFWTLKDHDYYVINLFILPVFILLGSIFLLQSLFKNRIVLLALKGVFAVLIIYNIQYSMKRMDERYGGWMNLNYKRMEGFYDVTAFLRENGIQPEEKVISFSDYSHLSLYLMNQRGWSRYVDARFNREKPVKYNHDSAGISRSLSEGAKYLIVNGFEDLYKNDFLKPFTRHLKLTYKNILVFEPRNPLKNFKFQERDTLYTALCRAENIDATGKYYLDTKNQYLFQFNHNRSNEFSLSGSWSVVLNRDNPYGMTHRVKNLKYGESIEIRVWKKGSDKYGVITAQADDMKLFHKEGNSFTGRKVNGWYEMRLEFFIPFELEGQELKIFIYNPDDERVYIDDFMISRYSTVVNDLNGI